jgi:hypothetical protein
METAWRVTHRAESWRGITWDFSRHSLNDESSPWIPALVLAWSVPEPPWTTYLCPDHPLPRALAQFDQIVRVQACGLAIGAARNQQVDGTSEHLVGTVAANDLETAVVGHRRLSRSAAERALLALTAASSAPHDAPHRARSALSEFIKGLCEMLGW